jgi:hypothetical protein
MPVHTHLKRPPARITARRGCIRTIRPNRARDEDLHIFLWLSEQSLRVTARDLDQLIRPV